jgi:uncharacterized membrane protein YphA (DoxX/SURF4 family)
MLVLLRVSIGWHFLYAGIDKLTSPNFTSAGYLGQAKGPLADKFHELVPDWDGRERFGAFEVKPGDELADATERRKAALEAATHTNAQPMVDYRKSFVDHYKLTREQAGQAKKALDQRTAELRSYLDSKLGDFEDYFHDLKRHEEAKKKPDADVPYEQKRNWDAQTKLRGKLASWSTEIDRINNDLHKDLETLLTPDQEKMGGVKKPIGDYFTQDNVIIYTNMAIGVCLILGLFTRLASLGGAIFLLSVVLASPDYPGLYPLPPPSAGRTFVVGKEFIEMMALFALATLPVGRWAGLDFFIHHLLVRPVYGERD